MSTTGAITNHNVCFGGDKDTVSRNGPDDADDSIVLSSSLPYWGRTTKQVKDDILQRHVVYIKSKHVPKVLRERDIHHGNAMKAIFQTFGAAEHFFHNK